ncbi:hypothetical protein CBL_12651 [Carabus blaptoides fortunei]
MSGLKTVLRQPVNVWPVLDRRLPLVFTRIAFGCLLLFAIQLEGNLVAPWCCEIARVCMCVRELHTAAFEQREIGSTTQGSLQRCSKSTRAKSIISIFDKSQCITLCKSDFKFGFPVNHKVVTDGSSNSGVGGVAVVATVYSPRQDI